MSFQKGITRGAELVLFQDYFPLFHNFANSGCQMLPRKDRWLAKCGVWTLAKIFCQSDSGHFYASLFSLPYLDFCQCRMKFYKVNPLHSFIPMCQKIAIFISIYFEVKSWWRVFPPLLRNGFPAYNTWRPTFTQRKFLVFHLRIFAGPLFQKYS